MNRYTAIFLILMSGAVLTGQDTITVMHYNLLNYGNTTTYCTQSNNNINDKAAAMSIVCTYIGPDIITVNEFGANSFAPGHFLNNVLNVHGVNYYQAATFTNVSSSDLVNFLFYDSRRFVLHSQHAIATNIRDINIYRLYHNDPNLSLHQDTAILYVLCTHLKAGNSSSDRAERASMAKLIMDSSQIWSGYPALLTGDLNLYTSGEQAWKELTEPADTSGERFFDPIEMPGAWQDNPAFAAIHTQSTRATSNGCAAGGGLDDRFDFILINKKIKNNPQFYSYIPGTYKAIGNDGNHLNLSINSGTNTSAPPLIIQSLYDASDHLPVVMELLLEPSTQSVNKSSDDNGISRFSYVNGTFHLEFEHPITLRQIVIYDLAGRAITVAVPVDEPTASFSFTPQTGLSQGLYIIRASDTTGRSFAGKVLVEFCP